MFFGNYYDENIYIMSESFHLVCELFVHYSLSFMIRELR